MNKLSRVGAILLSVIVFVSAIAVSILQTPQTNDPKTASPAEERADGIDQNWPTTFPTETDPIAEARATAESVADNDPDAADPSILDTIEAYLEDEDAYIRQMGASALLSIAVSETAENSGLRDAALADSDLLDALYGAIGYYPTVDVHTDDEETRSMAVQALAVLYHENPNPTVETALTDQYNVENSMWVRYVIVEALGQHRYTSTATEEVLIDAKDDYDADVAELADGYLDQLYELRGP